MSEHPLKSNPQLQTNFDFLVPSMCAKLLPFIVFLLFFTLIAAKRCGCHGLMEFLMLLRSCTRSMEGPSSHMLNLSEEALEENISICKDYCQVWHPS
eukprot:4739262-Ditylum_brightwellii.AAC.1